MDTIEGEATSAATETAETETAETTETDTSSNCLADQVDLGDGCFGIRNTFALDVSPTDIALADFTGDGTVDLLLAGLQFRFALGDPAEVFLPLGPLPNLSGTGIAVGRINGDAIPDFAAIGATIELQVSTMGLGFLSEGPISSSAYDGAFADFDNDSDEDLIASGTFLRTFHVDTGVWSLFNDLAYAGQSVQVADFDGDNDVDVALAMPGSNAVAAFANEGTGALATPDGDGLLDAATVNFASDDVSLLLNGGLTLVPEVRFALSDDDDPTLIGAADLDGDSRVELVVTAPTMGRVVVLGYVP
jgi:hypothetical protein